MPPRTPVIAPFVATSADGYLDDASPARLILFGPGYLNRVNQVRGCETPILVGAPTIRATIPGLLIRDPRRRAGRAARGLPEHPARVTLTRAGRTLPPPRASSPRRPPPGLLRHACPPRSPRAAWGTAPC